jgi:hypothetical protein
MLTRSGIERCLCLVVGFNCITLPAVPAYAQASVTQSTSVANATSDAHVADDGRLVLPLLLGGVGIALTTVGASTGFVALEYKGVAEDHCSPTVRRCDAIGVDATERGLSFARLSVATTILGLAAIGGAIVLWQSKSNGSAVSLAPAVSANDAQARLLGHF